MSTPTAQVRRHFSRTVTVDVDIDAADLEDNGYHHEDECTAAPSDAEESNRQILSDWHDKAHGLTHWTMCHEEPCNQLTLDYRGMP